MGHTRYNSLQIKNAGWEDLVIPLTSGKIGALSKPDFDYTNIGYLFPNNDATEILYLIAQLPHSRKADSNLHAHIHWRQTADTVVGWKLDYKLFNIGAAVPAGFITLPLDTVEIPYTTGSIHQINEGAEISGVGVGISAMFLAKLYRDDATTTGDVLAWQFDLHYQVDTLGSSSEYVK